MSIKENQDAAMAALRWLIRRVYQRDKKKQAVDDLMARIRSLENRLLEMQINNPEGRRDRES